MQSTGQSTPTSTHPPARRRTPAAPALGDSTRKPQSERRRRVRCAARSRRCRGTARAPPLPRRCQPAWRPAAQAAACRSGGWGVAGWGGGVVEPAGGREACVGGSPRPPPPHTPHAHTHLEQDLAALQRGHAGLAHRTGEAAGHELLRRRKRRRVVGRGGGTPARPPQLRSSRPCTPPPPPPAGEGEGGRSGRATPPPAPTLTATGSVCSLAVAAGQGGAAATASWGATMRSGGSLAGAAARESAAAPSGARGARSRPLLGVWLQQHKQQQKQGGKQEGAAAGVRGAPPTCARAWRRRAWAPWARVSCRGWDETRTAATQCACTHRLRLPPPPPLLHALLLACPPPPPPALVARSTSECLPVDCLHACPRGVACTPLGATRWGARGG